MGPIVRLFLFIILSVVALGQCIEPSDGMIIKESVLFCSSTYDVPNGIFVSANNVVLDCGTAVLRGNSGSSEIGIRVENVNNITIKNCNILTFDQSLFMKNVTDSSVVKNSFLKNRIGIRLLNCFENNIRDNNDKSFEFAVSAINSKFNVVMLGNKNIERGFCDENACNEYRDMNVCVSGDFYCSKKCSAESDSDCQPISQPVIEKAEPKKSGVEVVEEIVKQAEEEIKTEMKEEVSVDKIVVEKNLSLPVQILIYITAYIFAFILFSLKKR